MANWLADRAIFQNTGTEKNNIQLVFMHYISNFQ